MLGVLAHRGPDDRHLVHGDGFTLGARRLSIVDALKGRQPLSAGKPPIWAAQNGVICNFREVREELIKADAGQRFFTDGDTELIPHLYRAYGLEFPKKLEGMYAISLFDEDRRQGVLVRDRVGEKPLYYLEHEGALWYASEIKALLQVPGFQRSLNLEAVHHFLSYKNVPGPLSIFQGIRQLPPAHRLVWKEGAAPSLQPYWRLNWAPLEGTPEEAELAEEFLCLLKAGVRRRLLSDGPVGLFLSGGIDSSLVTALAAELSPTRLKTFTLAYPSGSSTPGKELDLRCAREVAERYGTDHHEAFATPSDFQREFPDIISHFDEPFAGAVSTYFLARLVSRHGKVALSGDGSDELFGSYLTHRLARPLAELSRVSGKPGEEWHWKHRLSVFTDDEKRALYSGSSRDAFATYSTSERLQAVFGDLTARDPTNRILEAEFLTQLPDQVLAFSDRLSMAHGLEVRTAFLDTQVMEFVARLPERFKIQNKRVKAMLKTAAGPLLPSSVVDRSKEGFVLPVNRWLQGCLFTYAKEALAPSELARHDLFDQAEVQRLLTEFQSGKSSLANKILSLLSFQIWYDIYMTRQLPVPLGEAARVIVEQGGGDKKLVTYQIASAKVAGVSRPEVLI